MDDKVRLPRPGKRCCTLSLCVGDLRFSAAARSLLILVFSETYKGGGM
ncbi:hypothetical protein SAMN05660235_02944 [Sporolituus thermophilus DSM 23256]|uniref:Uncharacterized protein n=1 Tax=Sporolituus thermophilus DSM 23256 TaxID=1123285 RepID=A0A1G7PFI4_9FIRM|nr:hypothetical protein SAMN05660235_02944 [Sporolituus thermophilus DSM 23256]